MYLVSTSPFIIEPNPPIYQVCTVPGTYPGSTLATSIKLSDIRFGSYHFKTF